MDEHLERGADLLANAADLIERKLARQRHPVRAHAQSEADAGRVRYAHLRAGMHFDLAGDPRERP